MRDKFSFRIFCLLFGAVFIIAGCSKEQETSRDASLTDDSEIVTATKVLATIGDDEKPQSVPAFMGHASPLTFFQVMFSKTGRGVVYAAEKDGKSYVVHNGKAGKLYATIGEMAISADGRRIAYGAIVDGKWRMVIDGSEGNSFDTVKDPLFSPDGKHVAYKAMRGEKWFIVVDEIINSGTISHYSGHEFNAESTMIAYVESADKQSEGRLVMSDLDFKKQTIMEGVGMPMITNSDMSRLAAVRRSKSTQNIIDISFTEPDNLNEGTMYDIVSNPAFGPDGSSLAYIAKKAGKHLLVLNDKEEVLPKGKPKGLPVVSPDNKEVSVIMVSGNSSFLHRAFSSAPAERQYDQIEDPVYSGDGKKLAYVAMKGGRWFIVHNGTEGPAFDMVVTPAFSPDGKYLVYRVRDKGERFVVVADKKGQIIKRHKPYELVFAPVFTADGRLFAYGVKAGNKLIWKVESL